jgi:chromate reductase, NAD(P)H dehydrogenase (quinone)
MSDTFNVAVLIGSLRANSYSSRVAAALEQVAPPSLCFRTIPIADLPLYNQDREGDVVPAAYLPFRAAIASSDAVLFVTPEYNRSVPGCLKNAIDVASRPFGKGAIIGKPAAVISQSPGAMGGFGANHAIRQSLVFLNMPVLQQPEAYLGQIAKSFDDTGLLTSDPLRELLTNFAKAFESLIVRSK